MHILSKWALATSGVKLARPHAIVDFTQQEHPWCLPLNQLTLGTILDAATADRSVRSVFFASPNRFYIPSSRSGEVLAAAKSVLLPFSVVEWRFSTVYGEFGRTDYPYYKFVEDITSGQDVQLWQQRKGRQNYIYIDDAVAVMIKMILDFTHVVGAVTVVDIGTPTPALSFKDVIRVVTKISGKKQNSSRLRMQIHRRGSLEWRVSSTGTSRRRVCGLHDQPLISLRQEVCHVEESNVNDAGNDLFELSQSPVLRNTKICVMMLKM
ncbi:hypothetical protein SELMODRAFT_442310 [Selaginella moellendorffii]|uniref:NAD-dependent epimerase/dehydratase domain-containing protein n=1 Tax=Selaginella moellendorffii TaxID=88036 RepID=D8RSE6_SELML|nr:hypothetical protein SELMODRAFT_442310 [Selaginella moellendorffii]